MYPTGDSRNQQVHILYGGANPGDPQANDGHGHYVYGIPGDRTVYDRPPAS